MTTLFDKFKIEPSNPKGSREKIIIDYFIIPKDTVLPISNGHEILSCGINKDNPKNKIKFFTPELGNQINMALIYFNQEFNLIDFGDDIVIKDNNKHFSCKFFLPLSGRENVLISETTNLYELFKKNSYHIPFDSILAKDLLPKITYDRFNVYLVLYGNHAYLLVEDKWYPVFMYADLALAQKHTKHDHPLECESAAHSLATIVRKNKLKLFS